MGKLGQSLSQYWSKIQGSLFPELEEQLDPLTKKQQQLVTILEVVRIEQYIPDRALLLFKAPTKEEFCKRLLREKDFRFYRKIVA